MKNLLFILLILGAFHMEAQVAVGKTSTTNNSVSLEFSESENRGLILPYIENKTDIIENGTLIYDVSDNKVKYLKNGSWVDLSIDSSGSSDISIQTTKSEISTAKLIIGPSGNTDTVLGILVLTASDKAMILPKVASPHLNIYNPAAGMIVYDTVKKQLAIYNGNVWSFWKP
jgi:hypothetical protein